MKNIILIFLLNFLVPSTDETLASNLLDYMSGGNKEDMRRQSDLAELKNKMSQIDKITRLQDNKILYMAYKTDSLKNELSKHQIAFDEYKRETQQDIALLASDLKGETSRRKADDRKINKTISKEHKTINRKLGNNKQDILEIKNALEPIRETVSVLEDKIDRIKEKYFMDEDEYIKYKNREHE